MSVCPKCGGEHSPDTPTCPVDGAPKASDARTFAGRASARRTPSAPGASRPASAGSLPSLAEEPEPLSPPATLVDEGLKPGERVGEYTVGEKIGEGGMGTVYAGVHPVIGKKVAIKLLNVGLAQDPQIVQRFVQEARAAIEIGHPNIVDIFAFGQLPNGRHYYVMEFLQGRSLKRRLEEEPPLTWAEAFSVLGEVADALAAAHEKGVVHRDLKPDNIFLVDGRSGAGRIKLLDFGIAKLLRPADALEQGQTRTGAPLGTPYYMSPEQCRSKAVDARSDIYAMGVILFEVFTARLPFAGPDYIDTVNGHLSGQVPLPSDFAEVPGEIESLILACLEKDPDKRPQRAEDLRDRLSALGEQVAADPEPRSVPLSVNARAHTMPATPVANGRGSTPRVQPRTTPARRTPATLQPPPRGHAGWWVAALALAVSIGAVAFVIVRAPTAPPPAPPAAAKQDMIVLQIVSEPPGAHVKLDGELQALLTPNLFRVPRADAISVCVEKDGYERHVEEVRVPRDKRELAIDAKLEREAGRIAVHATAPGGAQAEATFVLDGKTVGRGAALSIERVAPGAHTLRVEAKGLEARELPVLVEGGGTRELDVSLAPAQPPSGKKKTRERTALPDAPNTDFEAPR